MYSNANFPVRDVIEDNYTTTFLYDALNRLLEIENRYDGLGNRLSVTNGAAETTAFEYDAVNRLKFCDEVLSKLELTMGKMDIEKSHSPDEAHKWPVKFAFAQ